jgi:hypothetical protein
MTLRTRLLVIGAISGADGRQKVLRLGLRGRWRKRFAALLERIAALHKSIPQGNHSTGYSPVERSNGALYRGFHQFGEVRLDPASWSCLGVCRSADGLD